MDTGLAESPDDLRQAIDDEINSLQASIDSIRASIWALKSRRNALAPISCLPPETLAAIFSFLSPSANNEACHLEWISVSHVCRRWRDAALTHACLWSHINFSKLPPAAMTEIPARAKMTPLHLEADFTRWRWAEVNAFQKQLEVHISHTRHLSIYKPLPWVLERLSLSAPALESFSLSHNTVQVAIPVNLFNCAAPSLTSLELKKCNISWKSPLLRKLRTLKIRGVSDEARPELEDWLDALGEMPQLKTLVLSYATPLVPLTTAFMPEPSRTVTLPSLTKFHISAFAKDCVLALAHLVLPALTCLHVNAESHERDGEDVRLLIPYVSRNVYVLQDTELLRSILVDGKSERAEVVAWTMFDADLKFFDPNAMVRASDPAPLIFTATSRNWRLGVDTAILESLLTHLPANFVSTLTARNNSGLGKEFWARQAPKWSLLERASLTSGAITGFTDMLAEDAPPDGPRLPSLTKLILVDVEVTVDWTRDMRDMLIERVGQGVPLEVLDLSMSFAVDREINSLKEIVVDVKEPQREGRRRK
jgi:hypothetical protein